MRRDVFTEAVEQDFDIFNDRVTLRLLAKSFLFGTLDGVLEQVEQSTNAGCFLLFNQPLATAPDKHRLHVGFGLREIKKLPAVRIIAHLKDTLPRAVFDI